MNTLSALALAFAAMFGPASTPVVEAPQCATMGEIFQCDEERALSLSSADIWEKDFNLTYVTTRLDGVQPVVGADMLALQDPEFPSMWHVYNLRYAPMLHV